MALRIGRSLLNKRLRDSKKTQKQLAKHLGLSQSFISMVANNEREFNIEQMVNAAEFIGCDIMDLNEWTRT